MPTLIVVVDLECCRCSAKIRKVLSSIHGRAEFAVEKVVYEEEKSRVLVSGPFDADKLCCKLRCKAGGVIKSIEVAKPPPAKPKQPKHESEPAPCNLMPYPYPYPYPWPCSCATPYCEYGSSKPPAAARQPACQCSYPPYQVPAPPMVQCTPLVVCEEIPPYGACAIM